jgi:hypothetical protein
LITSLGFESLTRLAWLFGVCLVVSACQARAYDVLCRDGNTSFEAYFHTGVQVKVGPPTNGRLAAKRICRATLSWQDQDIVVAENATELDLDMFGTDLGTGQPVAAFQVKESDANCCMTYKIYSLEGPPRLLRTLTGGRYFIGKDSNLDGRVEIWADDAAAVDGFEGFRASQIQFLPTCVLRFDEGRLLDVGSEFQAYFDGEINQLRAALSPEQLARFKSSDGKLLPRHSSTHTDVAEQALLPVKEEVLELVWAYLYSNREKQAWQILADLWPAADLDRIRLAILQARARGIRAQVDGVSDALPPLEIEHSKIYDSTTKPARPILVRYYSSRRAGVLVGKLKVDLVVDAAGKVWSVRVSGKDKAAYTSVETSTANWRFIPAFVDDQPVASRVRMSISLER